MNEIPSGMGESHKSAGRKKKSLVGRFLRMAVRNPRMIRSALRQEYRMNIGLKLERRNNSGICSPPVNLSFDLTKRCNLKCEMCQQNRHGATHKDQLPWYDPRRELPLSAWVSVLDQVSHYSPWLSLTGGEPLLYPHFKELVVAAKQRGFCTDLTTNGTFLADFADFIVEQGIELLLVSIDGPEQIHERVRNVPGVFQRTRAGIRAVVEARRRRNTISPALAINFTINKTNFAYIDRMVPMALELGADLIEFIHPFHCTSSLAKKHNKLFSPEFAQAQELNMLAPSLPDGEYFELHLEDHELATIQAGLDTARRQARQGGISMKVLPNLGPDLLQPYYQDFDYPFGTDCKYLWSTCRILPDGTVSPCLHVVAGNVLEQPLLEIWNGPQYRSLRQIISKQLFPACDRCCFRSFKRSSGNRL